MRLRKPLARTLFFLFLLVCILSGLIGVGRIPVNAAPRMQIVTHVVISQVYGGGGNAGATFLNDYVELFNPSDSDIPIDGWSIQYASPTGTGLFSANVVNLSGTLSAGQYYLVQLASGGAIGSTLPAPDATGSIDMRASDGKVVLVNTATGLPCNGGSTPCTPTDLANIVDLVGYGSANFFEGTNAAPVISNTMSDFRDANGCTDTDNNGADFVTGTPAPRNTASPAFSCTEITNVTSSIANGTYSSTSVPNSIDITVTFSNVVNVDTTAGTPTLLLETGQTDQSATYISGSGSNTLTFSYTIMVGDSSNDLDYVSTNSLALNGGTITDTVGAVDLTLPGPGSAGSLGANKNIVIDNGLPPSVTINQASGQADPTSTSPINFTAIFSEVVTGFDNSDVILGGTAGATSAVVSGGPTTYNVAVGGMTTSGTVVVSIPAGAAQDLVGNGNTAGTSADNSVTFNLVSPTSVVISEFRTRGPDGAEDEYIELYNPTSSIVDMSGWKINVSNDTGTISTRATIPASTILRSGQYYLIAKSGSGGYSGVVPANLTYGQGITDAGGIALVKPDNITIVDQVGVGANSAYKEDTYVSLSPASGESYERKLGGSSDSCQDTNNNREDFLVNPSDPKNYASQLSRCGTLLPIPVLTTTTITADTPDPSLVNANVSVSVKVTGGSAIPSGQVNITGANSNCTITLNSSGTGSCSVRFTSTGTKTLTATYVGDQTHLASSDTESHQVSTTLRAPTPTRVPTLPPPPPLIAINEFVPRPGSDWNGDGVVNQGDEYIELLNHGVIPVNLSGYRLDDEANIGSNPFSLPSVTLQPGERIVFYGSQTGLLLSDGGDGVRLLRPNGQLMDAYNYFVVYYPDQAFCRLPDNGGADDWNENCFPTPGLKNSLSGSILRPPAREDASQPLCPIADTLPEEFVIAECAPFGNNIWNRLYWDRFGWYGEMPLLNVNVKWEVFAD